MMKIIALITVTSCLLGFAVGGGDTIKDFEYVDDEAIGIEWRVDNDRRLNKHRHDSLINF